LVYTGTYYPRFHDISPLFAALQRLGPDAERVNITFYSRYMDAVLSEAQRYSMTQRVISGGRITYKEALQAQMQADIALLCVRGRATEISDDINLPVKLFEYLGARRPILCMGLGIGAASNIVRQQQAGLVSNDPDEIAAQLKEWLDLKAQTGSVPNLPLEAQKGYTRDEQFARVVEFLEGLSSQQQK
jgi:glycosyltransferase involved in cell wall biosynthesis